MLHSSCFARVYKLRYATPLHRFQSLRFLCGFLFFLFFSLCAMSGSQFVRSVLSRASVVGVCGSRSIIPPVGVFGLVSSSVLPTSVVACGCVSGVCALARSAFPWASVFPASSFGSGRSSFARRSIALVSFVASSPSSVWVSFPGVSCPVGLVPSSSSSRCFAGFGSGSWASLAFACGSGVPCFVWLAPGLSVPCSWGFAPLGGGWWGYLNEC